MGRMLAVGLGPLALGLLFLALLGGVQGEVSIPEKLNVTAEQLKNSQQMRNYCDRKIESLDCTPTSKNANEKTCLQTSVAFMLRKEAHKTIEEADAVLNILRGLDSVARSQICAFMNTTTTTPVPPSATNDSAKMAASPGTNPTAEAAEDPVALYWRYPLFMFLFVIVGLIGMVIRCCTKRVGFQSSGTTAGGEPIKNDESHV